MEHFGQKVEVDGYKFDSKKEAQFYLQFIKPSGKQYEVHPHYRYADKASKDGVFLESKTYTPDFVVYENGDVLHVYDVKTSISLYGMTKGAKDTIYWFQRLTPYWVELVVPRKHDFQMRLYGPTDRKLLDAHAMHDRKGNIKTTSKGNVQFEYWNSYKDLNYDIHEFVGY